jgi:sigma-B regulation protein RsbU (phosphoserine phosphatase)
MSADFNRLQHQLDLYKGLVEVSALINGITESNELLAAVLDVARRVMNAEAGSLFLVNAEGALELVVATNAESPAQRIVVPRGKGIAGWVLENGRALLVPDAYADPRFYREADKQTGFRTRSILCVPLLRTGTEIGVLQVLNPIGREAFDSSDLAVFEAYGNLVATAIEKLRTIERQQEQKRLQQEFAFARDIQNSFLPQQLPRQSGLSFAAHYRPARHVGGDFYDVMDMGGNFFFVIGDVSGKGMPAALLMAQALSTLRLILEPTISPAIALSRWNDMLCGTTIRGMFITALLGRINPEHGEVEIASCGHSEPLLIRKSGAVEPIPLPAGPPLGVVPDRAMRSRLLTLQKGEWLVAYTDGLSESFNPARQSLDESGIARLVSRPFASAQEVVDVLQQGEADHRGEADPHDDLTLLVFGCQ